MKSSIRFSFFTSLWLFGFHYFKKRNPDNEALSGFTCSFIVVCDPPGARTQDPNIKSVVLYLL
ncbi:hypothetical protein, partial [Bacteroides heparinolyticus]|uniref:hypothetical protein n=1 Tax=Prevotella heparinolytica TaxID=28113 RepID=UPI00359FD08B